MGLIFGVDEAGIGCMAGPCFVVAVGVEEGVILPACIKDSKKVRNVPWARKHVDYYAAVVIAKKISVETIDRLGIWAAWERQVVQLLTEVQGHHPTAGWVDGTRLIPGHTWVTCMKGADAKIPVVSAASLVAKDEQLLEMRRIHAVHSAYGFDKHHAYVTKEHVRALATYGAIKQVHRAAYVKTVAARRGLEIQWC